MTVIAGHERTYGWIKTPEHIYAAAPRRQDDQTDLPDEVDLRELNLLPPVVDQGQLGSCTANAEAGLVGYDVAAQGGVAGFAASRLFIYWNERQIEGTTSSDSGATIADSVKAVQEHGAPPETDWPYDIEVFTHKPPAKAYTDGLQFEAIDAQTVAQSVDSIVGALAAKRPVAIGFSVYPSFESAATGANGAATMPQPGESSVGGHATLVVAKLKGSTIVKDLQADNFPIDGIDPAAYYWGVRNSWSAQWGHKGYFYLPLAYLTDSDLSSDFWTIEHIGPSGAPFPGA